MTWLTTSAICMPSYRFRAAIGQWLSSASNSEVMFLRYTPRETMFATSHAQVHRKDTHISTAQNKQGERLPRLLMPWFLGAATTHCASELHQAWNTAKATMSYSCRRVITKAFAKAQGQEAEAEITRAFSRSSKSRPCLKCEAYQLEARSVICIFNANSLLLTRQASTQAPSTD
eukprot:1147564-Pelagomonas_calceolata.AAC.2